MMNDAGPSQPPTAMPPARMPLQIWGATDKGRSREGNEDAIYPANAGTDGSTFKASPERIAEKGQLLIVADGVGGAEAGREASHWAIRVATERYYDAPGANPGINLRQAVETANASLFQYVQSLGTRSSGTTMVAAVIHHNRLHYVNVGDSRAYLFREGALMQLTRDHSVTQMKLDQGLITPEEAALDPERNVITRSLGARPAVDVDLFPPIDLQPGDVILLCSDGLTDMLSEAQIAELIAGQAPRRAAQRLIDAANRAGGGDNISAVVARIGGAAPNGVAAGAPLSRGRSAFLGMKRGQQWIVAGLAGVLVLVLLTGGGLVAWRLLDRDDPRGTATPDTAAAATELPPTTTASPTAVRVLATLEQAPDGTPTGTPAPTVTARPTATPTEESGLSLPRPQEPEPVDTPALPELTATPEPTSTYTPQPSAPPAGPTEAPKPDR